MATTTIMSLLQAAFLLLTGVKGGVSAGSIPPAAAQSSINIAGNAVQIATQAAEPIGFDVKKNDGIWPNMVDLLNAPYRDTGGKWVRLGAGGASNVQLMQGDTSFGDLNSDGFDDAAAIIKKGGYYLAAMLNQGGIMFDIAEMPLGADFDPSTATHSISEGIINLNGKKYRLIGGELANYYAD